MVTNYSILILPVAIAIKLLLKSILALKLAIAILQPILYKNIVPTVQQRATSCALEVEDFSKIYDVIGPRDTAGALHSFCNSYF